MANEKETLSTGFADTFFSKTYNLADLGFGGPVCIKTPTVFDVSCSDEWVSKEMK